MLLGFLASSFAPAIATATGIGALASPLIAGSVASGLGSLIETGDVKKALGTGLGSFAGGSLMGSLMGGTAANAAPGAVAARGVPAGTMGPATAGQMANFPKTGGFMSPMQTGNAFMRSPQGLGMSIGSQLGAAAAGGMPGGAAPKRPSGPTLPSTRTPNPATPAPAGYRGGLDPEWDYFQTKPTQPTAFAGGGALRRMSPVGYASGGIATLAPKSPTRQIKEETENNDDKKVVSDAVAAIKGQTEKPELALAKFLARYGEQAFRDLVDQVQSGALDATIARSEGKMEGPGDGMDDTIPAKVEDGQDVLLSDGEFVVPADVVSGIGNGSSDAGVRALHRMMDRVRTARTGTTEQPEQVKEEALVPA